MSGVSEFDIVVIGAGIAGASAAALLAAHRRVALVEREEAAGYHSTGRSAALWSAIIGEAPIRALTIASRGFLDAPPPGFAAQPLLRPRGVLVFGGDAALGTIEARLAECRELSPNMRALDRAGALACVPILRPERVAAAFLEPDAADIDVAALHQGFLGLAKARGARIALDAGVLGLSRGGGAWMVETRGETLRAPIVINAAGAWADAVAQLAGLAPLGLVPHRRTGLIVPLPAGMDPSSWPLFENAGEDFYARPNAGRLMLSPADQTPSEACDARPDELDIAIAIDRFEGETSVKVTRVISTWAGLRTFASDHLPAVGFDPHAEGFFWLAGQGGVGIQTSPAMAALATGLIVAGKIPATLADLGLDAGDLDPGRLALA